VRSILVAGPWLPDLADHDHDGLVKAGGVYAIANGYRPLGSLEANTTALPGISGGGAFISSDGTSALLAGTGAALNRWTGAAWASGCMGVRL
jgi:hypothetical protein